VFNTSRRGLKRQLTHRDSKIGLTAKETTEEVVELDAENQEEAGDEVEDTDEETVDNLEDNVDGVVNLLEEEILSVS
jgi:hypothetical protein